MDKTYIVPSTDSVASGKGFVVGSNVKLREGLVVRVYVGFAVDK